MTHPPMDPLRTYAELGRIALNKTSLDGIFQRITDLARHGLPGADQASITLLRERPWTAAASGESAQLLDEAQYEHRAGPCLQAATQNAVVSVPDIAAEPRWPEWTREATAAGIRSVLSVALPIREAIPGSLNVYSHARDAFDDGAIAVARNFAGCATVVLGNAHLYDTALTENDHLRRAMEHRAVIERAKGIVMSERRCTAEEAFETLVKISQHRNRKLREIAFELVTRFGPGPARPGSRKTDD